MAETSKELLNRPEKPSVLETLLLGRKDGVAKAQESKGRPTTTAVPKSQVLGKVKDFLGVMAEANEKLEQSAQGECRANYDIEVLSGNEREYIEMDLLVGVADLHTAEAVAAAEATIDGFQPSITSVEGSSSDTEDDSDEDDHGNIDITTCPTEKPDSNTDQSLHYNKPSGRRPNKRPKIIVLK